MSCNRRAVTEQKKDAMLQYSLVFFIVAVISAVFGFGGIAAGAVEIAKVLFVVFLLITAVTFLIGVLG